MLRLSTFAERGVCINNAPLKWVGTVAVYAKLAKVEKGVASPPVDAHGAEEGPWLDRRSGKSATWH